MISTKVDDNSTNLFVFPFHELNKDKMLLNRIDD